MRKLPWQHPYRDTALIYGTLAGLVVAIAAATDGPVLKALMFAGIAFAAGTVYSWWYWYDRLQKDEEKSEE